MDIPRATNKVAVLLVLVLLVFVGMIFTPHSAGAAGNYPNRTVFKGPSSARVYVIENGGYYWIPNSETLNTCYGGEPSIHRWSDATVQSIRSSYPFLGYATCRIEYPNRTTLLAPSSPKVYVILNGRKYWVDNGDTLGQCLGGDPAIRRISNAEMAWSEVYYPYAGVYTCPPTYPDGTTLVAPSSPRVYVIMTGRKYWVPDPATLNRCLGGDPAIRRISDAQMARTNENYPYAGNYSCPAQGQPPASARNLGYNPFAAHFSNQCTYFAEQRMAERTGMYIPVTGNAYQWATQARNGGWTVGASPAVNSVAVFPQNTFGSQYGHVAWVTGVSGNTLAIQDYNWNGVGAQMTNHTVQIPVGTQFIYSDR